MNFSVSYQSPMKQQADEIRCPYNKLGSLFKFIKEHPEKRYCITIDKILTKEEIDKAIEQIDIVISVTDNYTVSCQDFRQSFQFLDLKYNTFLNFPVTDWETFSYLRKLEVTDIYIDGPLGFQCNAITAEKGDIKIRVSPTVSANSALSRTGRSPSSFFIRPEDLSLYEDAIDIIDFNVPLIDTETTLFNVYKRGYFSFNIDQLILGLPEGANNVIFNKNFAQERLNCAQKCNIPSRSCHICSRYFTIAEQMQKLSTRN